MSELDRTFKYWSCSRPESGGQVGTYGPGTLIEIPPHVTHRTVNSGDGTARLVLYFDSAANVVTFDDPLMPMDVSSLH